MTVAVAASASAGGGPTPEQIAAQIAQGNADYMARSRRVPFRFLGPGGNGVQAYAAGQVLTWYSGPVTNGFLQELILDVNLVVTYTAGTGTIASNQAWPWNVVGPLTILLNGQIAVIDLYDAMLYRKIRGYLRSHEGAILAGLQDAEIQLMEYNVPTVPVAGANTVHFKLRIPLNMLHPLNPAGLLPVQGTANPVQVTLNCPAGLGGPDPLNNSTLLTGTATLVVTSGNITVYGMARDGRTFWSPDEVLPLVMDGLPAVNWDREPALLLNQGSGVDTYGQLTKALQIYFLLAKIIDGTSSANFCLEANIQKIALADDSTGGFKLLDFGDSNIGMDLFWLDVRGRFGQDWPKGVIPLVYAPHDRVPDASSHGGTNVLNMTPGGWTSLYFMANVLNLTSANGIIPRVVFSIIGANQSSVIPGALNVQG